MTGGANIFNCHASAVIIGHYYSHEGRLANFGLTALGIIVVPLKGLCDKGCKK